MSMICGALGNRCFEVLLISMLRLKLSVSSQKNVHGWLHQSGNNAKGYSKSDFIKTNNPITWVKYKEARNLANKSVISAKSEYYHSKIESNLNNPKVSWNIINQLLCRKPSNSSINQLIADGQIFTESQDISQLHE